ncbi:hypothetical protein PsorP6_003600 [Peronosclerospora sorghi]|uniref:Uncharacterized protein n=1 Tax=Peronosclerospora sorghi TaxID=230839 RepID=A0ACC0VM54_9STRA|nr:hypothetical protein PsorP6_003600 [Peronosclerospora sorghi]
MKLNELEQCLHCNPEGFFGNLRDILWKMGPILVHAALLDRSRGLVKPNAQALFRSETQQTRHLPGISRASLTWQYESKQTDDIAHVNEISLIEEYIYVATVNFTPILHQLAGQGLCRLHSMFIFAIPCLNERHCNYVISPIFNKMPNQQLLFF